MTTRIIILSLALIFLLAGLSWAVVWFPGYRIPVGWEYTRDQFNGLIEEESGGDYILDEQDNGPRGAITVPRQPRL